MLFRRFGVESHELAIIRRIVSSSDKLLFDFRRTGNDLILRMNLDLVESLCGFQKVIRTLDDRDLVITVIPGKVLSPFYPSNDIISSPVKRTFNATAELRR